MNRKPIIGATPYRRKEAPYDTYVPTGIVKAVERLGGEVRMFDYLTLEVADLENEVNRIDGFIFSGGMDVHPRFYGEEVDPACGEISEKRDEIELNLFAPLLERNLPILGICRGCQVINVAFGGTLHQHMDGHRQDDAQGRFWHEIDIRPDTWLKNVIRKDTLLTNSYHHQAVKALAPGFVVSATARDSTVEGFEYAGDKFIVGLQWHPETTLDDDAESILPFEAFMNTVRKRMEA